MAGNVPFLMKDVVLLAVSIYLLKQGVVRILEAGASTSVALSQLRRLAPELADPSKYCDESDGPVTTRATIDVDSIPISYLAAGEGGPLVLLIHGTYWSRVWQPVLDEIEASTTS